MHYEHFQPINTEKPVNDPVLLLSGMASDSASWQPVIKGLQAHYELLIPDNRCTGRTRPFNIETSRQLMVGDTLALLDSVGIDRVNIIGHSMGGMLGWALATEAPERVSRLITASALPTVPPARIALFESLSALRNDTNEAHWFELLYQFLFSTEFFNDSSAVKSAVLASLNYEHKQNKDAFAQQVSGLRTFAAEVDLSRVNCPVTMITGRNDILLTPSMLAHFTNQNAQITTRVIDDAAHAIHWEQPAAFVSLALEVLAGQEPRV